MSAPMSPFEHLLSAYVVATKSISQLITLVVHIWGNLLIIGGGLPAYANTDTFMTMRENICKTLMPKWKASALAPATFNHASSGLSVTFGGVGVENEAASSVDVMTSARVTMPTAGGMLWTSPQNQIWQPLPSYPNTLFDITNTSTMAGLLLLDINFNPLQNAVLRVKFDLASAASAAFCYKWSGSAWISGLVSMEEVSGASRVYCESAVGGEFLAMTGYREAEAEVGASPTLEPTPFPTPVPTPIPTRFPTRFPTSFPTSFPTPVNTLFPTSSPTPFATPLPTNATLPTPPPTPVPRTESMTLFATIIGITAALALVWAKLNVSRLRQSREKWPQLLKVYEKRLAIWHEENEDSGVWVKGKCVVEPACVELHPDDFRTPEPLYGMMLDHMNPEVDTPIMVKLRQENYNQELDDAYGAGWKLLKQLSSAPMAQQFADGDRVPRDMSERLLRNSTPMSPTQKTSIALPPKSASVIGSPKKFSIVRVNSDQQQQLRQSGIPPEHVLIQSDGVQKIMV
jgi:hypothetical protein